MRLHQTFAVCTLAVAGALTGCVSDRSERESDRAARATYQDSERRAAYEHCRAAGQTDCDRILNAPVDPDRHAAPAPGAVMDSDRQAAYDRCRSAGLSDCERYLR